MGLYLSENGSLGGFGVGMLAVMVAKQNWVLNGPSTFIHSSQSPIWYIFPWRIPIDDFAVASHTEN